MSDNPSAPAESPTPEAEPSEAGAKKKNSKTPLIGCLIALAIVVLIVLGFLLLRGCSPSRTATPSQTTSQSTTSTTSASDTSLFNRVHAALHAKRLPNGQPLDNYVYVFEISTANGVGVAIVLTPVPVAPGMSPQRIATDCENAVLAGVPEVTRVSVVDANHVPVSAASRK